LQGPNLPIRPKNKENVILSAAAAPIQTRTNAGRRPKDLEPALGPRRPKRPLRSWFTLLMAKCGAAAATGPSVAAKLWGRRGFVSGDAQDDISGVQLEDCAGIAAAHLQL